MLDGNEDPHFKSEIASDKVLWAHNPQVQILFLYEKGFWAYPKIFFHQVVSEQGKDFLREERRMQAKGKEVQLC